MRRLRAWAALAIVACCASLLAQPEAPAALAEALRAAEPGDVVELGFAAGPAVPALNAAPNTLVDEPGRLVYSDDPETATVEGILYTATLVAGRNRVYFYHVNGAASSRRFALVVENAGGGRASFTLLRRAAIAPSGNYIEIGRQASRAILAADDPAASPVSIEPGARIVLDAEMAATPVTTNRLFHTLHDIEADGALRLHALMLEPDTDPIADFDTLAPAPDDGNNREGTFDLLGRTTPGRRAYDTASGVRRFRLAGGATDLDRPPVGTDEVADEPAQLRGSYGVVYRLELDVTSSDGRSVAVLLNPRGGGYGGWVELSADGGAPQGTFVPAASGHIPTTTHAGFAGKARAGMLDVVCSPAGASSLPIDVLLVPFDDGIGGHGIVLR